MPQLTLKKWWQLHLLWPTELLENKQLTGWEGMRHESRWCEKWQCCRVKSTSEVPAERYKQTHVPSEYLHQSYQRRHGCNILPPLHWLLPGSTNSHSGLSCISAYSLNTWLASEEERRDNSRWRKKTKKQSVQENQAAREFKRVLRQLQPLDRETGRDSWESWEKQALEEPDSRY